MAVITSRKEAMKITDKFREMGVSMAIFCTASHWNTEAILLAAQKYAEKHGLESIPLTAAMTFNYKYMPQAQRVTYSRDAKTGFISIMKHLQVLCGDSDSPYANVTVLPHLDHADPVIDKWALTDGLSYLASVMFDAQKYPYEENLDMTRKYVKKYGKQVMVEGIMEMLSVRGGTKGAAGDDYVEKAVDYIGKTGVDFLVADLGTEQQSASMGKCEYKKDRAGQLTKSLGQAKLVLHGTSSLTVPQMQSLAEDGIIRVNMWTRIAREAGLYAAEKLQERADEMKAGDFNATESKAYLYDSTEKAAEIMEEVLDILGYAKLI